VVSRRPRVRSRCGHTHRRGYSRAREGSSMHTAHAIVTGIDKHIRQIGTAYPGWYVGITSDIEDRLFEFHRVRRQGGRWIWLKALHSGHARDAEAAFHEAGCKGAGGGGDHTTVFVYAYPITPGTVE